MTDLTEQVRAYVEAAFDQVRAADLPTAEEGHRRGRHHQRRRRSVLVGLAGLAMAGLVTGILIGTGVLDDGKRPVIASAGRYADIVAVQGPNNGGDRLVVLSGDDGHLIRTLADDIGITFGGIAATPDGDTIFFTRRRSDVPCDRIEIATVARDGGPVNFIGPGIHPTVSPDGMTLAYIRSPADDPCGPRSERVWRDVATGDETVFPVNEVRDRVAAPSFPIAWSPDGSRMLLATQQCEGPSGAATCANDLQGSLSVLPMRSPTQPDFGATRFLDLNALNTPASGATYLPDGRVLVALDKEGAGGAQLHQLVVFDEAVQVEFRIQPGETIFESRQPGTLRIAAAPSGTVLFHFGGNLLQRWEQADPTPVTLADDIRDATWLPAAHVEPSTTTTTATTATPSVPRPDSLYVLRGDGLAELAASDGALVRMVTGRTFGGIGPLSLHPDGSEALVRVSAASNCAGDPSTIGAAVARVELENGDVTQTGLDGVRADSFGLWSADGRRYALSSTNCDGSTDLVIVEPERGMWRLSPSDAESVPVPWGWDADGRHLLVLVQRGATDDQWRYVDTDTSGDLDEGVRVPGTSNLGRFDLRPLGDSGRWVASVGDPREGTVPEVVEFNIASGAPGRILFRWEGLGTNVSVRIEASDASGGHLLLRTFVEGDPGFALYRWSEGEAQPTKIAENIGAADW